MSNTTAKEPTSTFSPGIDERGDVAARILPSML